VKPAPFTYERADSAADAAARLAEDGDAVAVLGGGQSLVPMMNLRLATPSRLLDITRAPDLARIERSNGHLEIGAAVRQAQAEDSPLVAGAVPLLHEALADVAHREIRNAGTIGGSVAHAEAAAEIPTVALTLDAEILARNARGTRTIAARDFFLSYLTTALEPDELLVGLRFPVAGPGSGGAFVELAARKGDYALVGVAAHVVLAGGRIERAALGYLGAGGTPLRAPAAEAALAGVTPTAEAFASAAAQAQDELSPPDDIHASSAYRRRVAGVLTRRALAVAVARARGEDPAKEEM